jgi:DNA (cytosine-5)-methyltransferase 1
MKTTIKVGSDFSGVGAFNQALMRLGIDYQEVFACDMDKFARQTFIHNYGEPEYYPMNVYDREIPKESLDIYMTSPPCQAFSMAGKRLGKEDARGILFFNSLEFIQVNNPRFFIFENVKGLLSHDKENKKDKIGRTFKEWIDYLGGKSVNGITTMMPIDGAVPYHLHYKVLNAKKHGVPQNRERVFLIGIRDDQDNTFTWPAEEELTKRLKNVLEPTVNDKYFLSENTINVLIKHQKFNKFNPIENTENTSSCITCHCGKFGNANNYLKVTNFQGSEISNTIITGGKGTMSNKHNWDTIKIGYINQDTQASALYSDDGLAPTMCAGSHGYAMGYIQVKSGTAKGYDEATEGDSINFAFASSDTRRGRVGKQVAQTLDTGCNQGVIHNCITEAIGRQGSSSEYIDSCKKVYQSSNQIRRLTPRECFRLMDFPDTFSWPVSDSQAYKQAGNSIVVRVLEKIINNLPL